MSKQKMVFAEHRSNGFVVDLVREGLGFKFDDDNAEIIEGMDSTKEKKSISRTSKRGTKENDIAVEKYNQNEKKLCNALIEYLFSLNKQKSEQDEREIEFFEGLVREFLGYFSQYKSHIQTLGAGQRQLDFITVAVFFVPFLAHAIASLGSIRLELLPENERAKAQQVIEPFIVDRILSNSSKSALQKVFELIGLSKDKIVKSLLSPEDLQNLKEAPKIKYAILEAPNKNVNNWSKGKEKPSLYNIKRIAKLGKTPQECRKIEILLKIARLSQSLYDKAKDYFGEDLANLLVEHFRLVSTIDAWEQHLIVLLQGGLDEQSEVLAGQAFKRLQEIKPMLYIHSLYDCGTDRVKLNGKYDKDLNERERQKFEAMQVPFSMTLVNEKDFFENINAFLITRIFIPQNSDESGLKQDFQEYQQARLKAFLSPNKDEIKKADWREFYNKDTLAFYDDIRLLGELTAPITIKDNENEKRVLKLFERLENKYDELDKNPFVCFLKARFYAQKLELEKANECYLNALKFGKNVLGGDFAAVVKEGLMVAAQLTNKIKLDLSNAKSPFTKFYKEAYFMGLITDLPDNLPQDDFNQYILLKMRIDFYHCAKGDTQSPSTLAEIKINFDKANEKIKALVSLVGLTYPMFVTPLMCCGYAGNKSDVERLLSNGAKVDILDENNASCLFYYVPDFKQTIFDIIMSRIHTEAENRGLVGEKFFKFVFENIFEKLFDEKMIVSPTMPKESVEIAKILIEKCSLETLNARTILERQTILSRCIRWGLWDLVKLLIEKGVDLDSKNCDLDNDLPISLCFDCIWAAKNKASDNMLRNMWGGMSKWDVKNFMRGSYGANFSNEIQESFELSKITHELPIMKTLQKSVWEYCRVNIHNYLKIAELIIDKMKNVNARQEKLGNITLLMDAADIDEPTLVKRLLTRGADKGLKDENGKTACDYAEKNRNLDLMIALSVNSC